MPLEEDELPGKTAPIVLPASQEWNVKDIATIFFRYLHPLGWKSFEPRVRQGSSDVWDIDPNNDFWLHTENSHGLVVWLTCRYENERLINSMRRTFMERYKITEVEGEIF